MTDNEILNTAEDCGLMVEIEDLESWEGMFAVDKAGLQKFARRIEADAQSGAEPVPKALRDLTLIADELCSALDAADLDVGGCRPFKEIFAELGPITEAARELLAKHYAAPQPTAAAQPTHLVRRGLRPDGTYLPADDDESAAATLETDAVVKVYRPYANGTEAEQCFDRMSYVSRKLERERNEARAALETTQTTMLRLKRETDEMSLRAITAETALEADITWKSRWLIAEARVRELKDEKEKR